MEGRGGEGRGVWIVLFSEVSLFDYNKRTHSNVKTVERRGSFIFLLPLQSGGSAAVRFLCLPIFATDLLPSQS